MYVIYIMIGQISLLPRSDTVYVGPLTIKAVKLGYYTTSDELLCPGTRSTLPTSRCCQPPYLNLRHFWLFQKKKFRLFHCIPATTQRSTLPRPVIVWQRPPVAAYQLLPSIAHGLERALGTGLLSCIWILHSAAVPYFDRQGPPPGAPP